MVPSIDDACAHMLPFRGSLIRTSRLLDADVEVLVGSDRGSVLVHDALGGREKGAIRGQGRSRLLWMVETRRHFYGSGSVLVLALGGMDGVVELR